MAESPDHEVLASDGPSVANAGPGTDERRVASAVREGLTTHLAGRRETADVGQVALAAATVFIFWGTVTPYWGIGWLAAFVLSAALRRRIRGNFLGSAPGSERVLAFIRWDIWLSASLWGVWALSLVGAPLKDHAFLMVIFAGLTAAGTNTMLADAPSFRGFLAILMVPLFASVAFTGVDRETLPFLVVILLFSPFMSAVRRQGSDILVSQLEAAARLKESEEEAGRGRDFLSSLLRSAPSPIAVLDGTGVVIRANPALSQITGTSVGGLEGTVFSEVMKGLGVVDGLGSFIDNVRGGVRSVTETPLTRPEADPVWVRFAGTLAEGAAEGTVILVGEDVTNQVAALRAQEAAREDAERVARAKSVFLSSMSHEIRTPMNGILGMVELLLTTDLDPGQRESAQIVRSSAESLLRVLNDILDVSRIEAGQMDIEEDDYDLPETLKNAAAVFSATAIDSGNELLVRIAPDVPRSQRGDAGRIRQVLVNLISNALRATEGGEVVVSAELATLDDGVPGVRFAVSDTGVGIPEDQQARIFEDFTRVTDPSRRTQAGTGLGLTISQHLVRLMGGEIEVTSRLGSGSTFHFVLPLVLGAETARPGRTVEDGYDLRGKKVLVVDDNDTARRIVREAMQSVGVAQVTEAPDGVSGLAVLRAETERGDPFDLVVVDHLMPGLDGLAMVGEARLELGDALPPVLILTSAPMGVEKGEADLAGVSRRLAKPVARDQLVHVMSEMLTERPRPGFSSSSGEEEAVSHMGRVLVAEDNLVNQKVAAAILTKYGYLVDVVPDGKRAVTAVASTRYDLVLMDIQMPEMDGVEATLAIRESMSADELPIVALTAHAFGEERARCFDAGMNDFLAKPFRPVELVGMVTRWALKPPVAPSYSTSAEDRMQEPSDGTPPVDIHGFRETMREVGIEEVVEVTLKVYVSESPGIMSRLHDAVTSGRSGDIRGEAHALKSSSGNIRAGRLSELLQRMEDLGHSGDTRGATELFPAVKAEFDAVMDFIGRST
ncbi:MAG: response regulator [Gemmatimonadota bacterium]|nr:response regulator [Gemmatimonadota bacterium]